MTTKQLYQSKRTIRLYGALGAKFGRVHRLAVSSTSEAIRALCALKHGFEAYMMQSKDNGMDFAIFIGKRNISLEEVDFTANNDIRIAPILRGSKNGGIVNIIIGVALIAASFFIPGSQPLLAAALMNAGVAMALGGVVMLLSPQPKAQKSKDKPENEPSYAFNGPINTQAQGNCVPVLYGQGWTGSAVISAGINVGDAVYIPSGYDPVAEIANAAEWFAALGDFWEFNGSVLNTAGIGGWTQTYGGGHSYTTGRNSQQSMLPTANERGSYTGTTLASTANWTQVMWVNLGNSVVAHTMFGRGENDSYGTNVCATMYVKVENVAGTNKIYVAVLARDSVGAFLASSYVEVGGGFDIYTLRWNQATKDLTLCSGASAIPFVTVNVPLGLYFSTNYALMMQPNGGIGAFGGFGHSVQDWSVYRNYIMPANVQAYLAQGKPYATMIAEAGATPPTGYGEGGDDEWRNP